MAKGLRLETRQRLRWCLDQVGEFTIYEASIYFGKCRMSIANQMRVLEEVGILAHRNHGHQKFFTVVDRELGMQMVGDAQAERGLADYRLASAHRYKPQQLINSVFALGSL